MTISDGEQKDEGQRSSEIPTTLDAIRPDHKPDVSSSENDTIIQPNTHSTQDKAADVSFVNPQEYDHQESTLKYRRTSITRDKEFNRESETIEEIEVNVPTSQVGAILGEVIPKISDGRGFNLRLLPQEPSPIDDFDEVQDDEIAEKDKG